MQVKTKISIDIPFNKKLYTFLLAEGYTHVYTIGADDIIYSDDYELMANYYLIPLPANHLLLNEQHNPQIMEMLCSDVSHMANAPVDYINFIMQLPADTYEKFIGQS